jgi:hypothetical protein
VEVSKLYGYLYGDNGSAQTKASNRIITSKVQTEQGSVSVELHADGSYDVEVGAGRSGGPRARTIAAGNVHEGGEHRRRAAPRSTARPAFTGRAR